MNGSMNVTCASVISPGDIQETQDPSNISDNQNIPLQKATSDASHGNKTNIHMGSITVSNGSSDGTKSCLVSVETSHTITHQDTGNQDTGIVERIDSGVYTDEAMVTADQTSYLVHDGASRNTISPPDGMSEEYLNQLD